MSTEAMKLALRSLKELVPDDSDHAPAIQGQRKRRENALKALQQALAQPQQEPTCKPYLQVWVQRTGQFSWEPQDERFWTRLTTPQPLAQPQQEPVAKVDANDEGYWADILPDRTVKVGQLLYAEAPQPAQQEPVEYWTVANGWVSDQAEVPAAVWVEPDFWEHCNRVNCGTAYRLPAPGRQPLYTSPPAQRKPLGFAGITIWGGEATVTKVFTESEITCSRDPSELIKQVVQQCLDELTAHGIKGEA